MSSLNENVTPRRNIVFRGNGVHDAQSITTAAGKNEVKPADPEARITYAISYPGVIGVETPEDAIKRAKDEATKKVVEEIGRNNKPAK